MASPLTVSDWTQKSQPGSRLMGELGAAPPAVRLLMKVAAEVDATTAVKNPSVARRAMTKYFDFIA